MCQPSDKSCPAKKQRAWSPQSGNENWTDPVNDQPKSLSSSAEVVQISIMGSLQWPACVFCNRALISTISPLLWMEEMVDSQGPALQERESWGPATEERKGKNFESCSILKASVVISRLPRALRTYSEHDARKWAKPWNTGSDYEKRFVLFDKWCMWDGGERQKEIVDLFRFSEDDITTEIKLGLRIGWSIYGNYF